MLGVRVELERGILLGRGALGLRGRRDLSSSPDLCRKPQRATAGQCWILVQRWTDSLNVGEGWS